MSYSLAQSQGVFRPTMRLALPVLLEQILVVLVGFVDTWLAGNFVPGAAPLAAIGLIAYTLWLLPNMFAVLRIGSTALIARFVGSGDLPLAVRVMNQSLFCGVLLSAVVMGLVYFAGEWFVHAMQLEDEAAAMALRYLRILTPVIPAIMVETVGIACLRGAGDTFSGFVAMSLVNLANATVSAALVIGIGPLPRLGWDGLAIGTAVGHVLAALLVLALLASGRAGLRLQWSQMWPDAKLINRLLRIGIPGGADVATILGCHLIFVAVINSLGTVPAAAHSLAIRIESLAYLPGTAFQVAATTLTGQFLGAGDRRRAVRGVLVACGVGGGLMVLAGVAFFLGAESLTVFFTGSPESPAGQLAVPLLRLVAFAMPSLAVTMILSGALRGAGDTRWPFLFTIIGFLMIRIPLGIWLALDQIPIPYTSYLLLGMGWGVMGAWYALVVDVFLRSGLVLWRFWHGGWQRTQV